LIGVHNGRKAIILGDVIVCGKRSPGHILARAAIKARG